jgi:phage head maturation protease
MIDRTIHITPVNDNIIALSGYVHGYEETQQVGFTEIIPRETFEAASVEAGTALVFDFSRDINDAIAYTKDGTLMLSCDDTGLKVDAIVNAEYQTRLTGCDFALSFRAMHDEWTMYNKDGNHRVITEITLVDIGVVQKPEPVVKPLPVVGLPIQGFEK